MSESMTPDQIQAQAEADEAQAVIDEANARITAILDLIPPTKDLREVIAAKTIERNAKLAVVNIGKVVENG